MTSTLRRLTADAIMDPYAVVTFSQTGYVHAYGPYSKKEANRIKRQFDNQYGEKVHSFVRKMILGDEVHSKPKNPKG